MSVAPRIGFEAAGRNSRAIVSPHRREASMSASPTADNPWLRGALWYARRGIAVFPCRPRTKLPLTEHGCKDATTKTDIIKDWWKRWPDANVAGATGDLVAVDVDEKDGISGSSALRRLET